MIAVVDCNYILPGELLLELLRGTKLHVFVDDYQAASGVYRYPATHDLEPIFKEELATDYLWITWDLAQWKLLSFIFLYRDAIIGRDITSENVVTISLNLRNTCDIAGILSKIREQIVKSANEFGVRDADVVLPALKPGHFIHGPRTVVHVIEKRVDKDGFNSSLVTAIIDKELDRLCRTGGKCTFDIGVVHNTYWLESFNDTIKSKISDSDCNVEVRYLRNCYSVEYPAVIVLLDVSLERDTACLYLMLSRARAYCSVIFYTTEVEALSACQPVAELLTDIENFVTILRYD